MKLSDGTWRPGHTPEVRKNPLFVAYVEAVGHEPPVPAPDDPLG